MERSSEASHAQDILFRFLRGKKNHLFQNKRERARSRMTRKIFSKTPAMTTLRTLENCSQRKLIFSSFPSFFVKML